MSQSEPVKLTIDGRQIQVEPNTLLVEAAAQLGILIPVYCYHPKLAPIGACRMCLVEVEGAPKLIASCTTPVREGMVVHTKTPRVEKARKGMLEFLLIHHPLDCPVCDKGGECPLQDFTYEFGPSRSRFRYPKRHWEKPIQIGQNILLDRERCIMCFRCVRFCEEISDHPELGVFERGNAQEIGVAEGRPFNSQFSGNTIELCPVGALTGAPTRFFGRTWEVQHTPSVCSTCATGCNVRIDHRKFSEIVRLWSRENVHTDAGWLCDRGRFNFEFVNEDRLESPMLKREDTLVPVGWADAFGAAAKALAEAPEGKVGVLASPRLPNEDLWMLSKFVRTVLKTNNIDHTVRQGDRQAADLYSIVRESGFRPGLLTDLDEARHILIIGTDVSQDQPVTELRIKKAHLQCGAKVVTVHTRDVELDRYASASVRYEPGQAARAISSLASSLEPASGSEAPHSTAAAALQGDAPKAIILGWRLAEQEDVTALEGALTELARALGESVPCIVIVEHCNSRGALDMGIRPAWLPGCESVTEPGARSELASVWGGEPPADPGSGGREMLEAAAEGRMSVLWLLGNEALEGADADLVRRAITSVPTLIYQGWSLPRLEREPDIVLACQTFGEQDGTYTNTDGRVQRLFRALRPAGRARPGWEIIGGVQQAAGGEGAPDSAAEVFAEFARTIASYRGITWGRLGSTGMQTAPVTGLVEKEVV